MIKCLILFLLSSSAAYSQFTTPNSTTRLKLPDPFGGSVNKLLMDARKNGKAIQVQEYDGFPTHSEYPSLLVDFNLSKEDFKNKRIRDSLFGTRYTYIQEALDRGFFRISICIKRTDIIIGGCRCRVYMVQDLINGK